MNVSSLFYLRTPNIDFERGPFELEELVDHLIDEEVEQTALVRRAAEDDLVPPQALAEVGGSLQARTAKRRWQKLLFYTLGFPALAVIGVGIQKATAAISRSSEVVRLVAQLLPIALSLGLLAVILFATNRIDDILGWRGFRVVRGEFVALAFLVLVLSIIYGASP